MKNLRAWDLHFLKIHACTWVWVLSVGVAVCTAAMCVSGGGLKGADRSSLVLLLERSFLKVKWVMSLSC